jgi:hypothetical protein
MRGSSNAQHRKKFRARFRQSVTLSSGVAQRVRRIAKSRGTSTSKVITNLIEKGLESQEAEKERFFQLTEKLVHSSNPRERQRLKDEIAKILFGV